MQKPQVGLFVGRFQPGLHMGHIDAFKQAVDEGIHDFVIAVGSSNKEFVKDNPFTYDERKQMIALSLRDYPGITYQIFAWPDMESDEEWKQYAFSHFPDFHALITGNPWVRDVFVKNVKDVKVVWLEMREEVCATTLRQELARGHWDVLRQYLSQTVVAYLQKINADERMKDIFGG